MNKKTIAVLCGGCVLLAGSLYYFFKDEPLLPAKFSQETTGASTGDITYSGNSLYEDKNGKRQWEMTAEHIAVDPQTHNVFLQQVKATLYQDNGGKIDVKADKAQMDNASKDIVLEGSVNAVDSSGATLTAVKFRRDGRNKRLYGSGGVRFTRDDTVATGDTVESDELLAKVKLSGNAHIIKGGGAVN